MQKAGATPTQTTAAPPFFSSSFFGGGGGGGPQSNSSSSNSVSVANATSTTSATQSATTSSRSRPGTSSGPGAEAGHGSQSQQTSTAPSDREHRQPNVLHKDRDRRPSFGSRKPSFTSSNSPSKGNQSAQQVPAPLRRGSTNDAGASIGGGVLPPAAASAAAPIRRRPVGLQITTAVPPVPTGYAASAAAKLYSAREPPSHLDSVLAVSSPASADSFSRMLGRAAAAPTTGAGAGGMAAPPGLLAPGAASESGMVHQHIQETANKRISTLDYLRKAHEGRVYWFNTLLFDKPDLARMPYFESRKMARRATNYLFLGLSLPTVIDLNSNTPIEFLRNFNILLSEFDSFQQLHNENGGSSGSLSRARLPQMFRRSTAVSRARRTSGANDIGYPLEPVDSANGGGSIADSAISGMGGGGSSLNGGGAGGGGGGGSGGGLSFAASEATDLLPGEEYTHLLTPSLPFDPDFFETFATLCDVLIDAYQRLLSLLPTPRECNGAVAELFTKADSRVRKIIIQGVVKEFEDSSRAGVKTEVANVGKVVLGGLM